MKLEIKEKRGRIKKKIKKNIHIATVSTSFSKAFLGTRSKKGCGAEAYRNSVVDFSFYFKDVSPDRFYFLCKIPLRRNTSRKAFF